MTRLPPAEHHGQHPRRAEGLSAGAGGGSAREVVDVVACGWCSLPLRRNISQFKRGIRYHKGRCANLARTIEWPESRVEAHMQMMRDAAAKTRTAHFHERLRQMAPDVDVAVAERIYQRGYKAGYSSRRRK